MDNSQVKAAEDYLESKRQGVSKYIYDYNKTLHPLLDKLEKEYIKRRTNFKKDTQNEIHYDFNGTDFNCGM